MRLDLFLTLSRLVKRRAMARQLAGSGAVRVGDAPAKASRPVRVGDELTVRLGRRELRLRVMALAGRSLPKAEARRLYEIIEETAVEEDPGSGPGEGPLDFLTPR